MSTKKPTAIDPGGRWLEYWSESSKAHFYFEIKTQATSFTKPAGVEFIPSAEYKANQGVKRPVETSSDANREEVKRPRLEPAQSTTSSQSSWTVNMVDNFVENEHDGDVRDAAISAMALNMERSGMSFPEEHPLVHIERKTVAHTLVQELKRLCIDAGLEKEPPGAYNRWMFVQKLNEEDVRDPLLPYSSKVETTLRWELERERKAGGKLMSRTEAEAVCSRITGRTSELIDSAIAPARERSNGRPDHVSMRFVEHRSQYELQFESERLHINTEHYDKLKKRYKKHTEDFADSDAAASATFHRRLFNLLCRYEALGGAGYQAAIPKSLFAYLQERLGVQHECFASPLNCTLDSFGSAFLDTDRFFGSTGSFYFSALLFANGGSFEANPPFVELPMLVMALSLEKYLTECQRALSFVIFVPGWSDTTSFYVMSKSRFNACPSRFGKYLLFRKHEHSYRDGAQHRSDLVHRTSQADSFVFFLQNDLARQKWPITDDVVQRIANEFKQ